MTSSKILVVFSLSFLLGVAASSLINFSWFLVWLAGMISLVLFISIGSRASSNLKIIYIALAIPAFMFGFVWTNIFSFEQSDSVIESLSPLRSYFVSSAGEFIGGNEHAVFSAMVLGERSIINPKLKEDFNRTGTTHIIAISGLHLAIVALVLKSFLITIGLNRRQAFPIALVSMVLFILLVGSPPSAVRAGFMAGLYLVAQEAGRLAQSWRLLLVAAAVMVLINPSLLVFDVGFQLSFLAVMGIIFFKPYFDKFFENIPIGFVRDLASVSLAAQVTTWPIIAYNFGTFSIIGIFANILVVPLLPIIMVLGLTFILIGWVLPFVAQIILWSIWILLHVIIIFISWLSEFSFASQKVNSFSLSIIFLYYIIAILAYVWVKNRYGKSIT